MSTVIDKDFEEATKGTSLRSPNIRRDGLGSISPKAVPIVSTLGCYSPSLVEAWEFFYNPVPQRHIRVAARTKPRFEG